MNDDCKCPRCGKPVPDLRHEESADFQYCFECFGKVEDERLVTRIFQIRRQNNIPWQRLMELALKHAPEEAKAALREITDNDMQVSALVRDLTK